jgi:hypothetical protein
MSSRRGKKINPEKNAGSARDFAAGKRIGRPKQVWVVDDTPVTGKHDQQPEGHWEKVNVQK